MMEKTNVNGSSQLFRIKAYGLQELGLLYFPHSSPDSARTQLKRWMRYHDGLLTKLKAAGYQCGQRILTPKQVRILVEHLDPP